MPRCEHCGHEIDEKILKSYLSSRGVEGARKKFGDNYKEEMKRRIKLRWAKQHVQPEHTVEDAGILNTAPVSEGKEV